MPIADWTGSRQEVRSLPPHISAYLEKRKTINYPVLRSMWVTSSTNVSPPQNVLFVPLHNIFFYCLEMQSWHWFRNGRCLTGHIWQTGPDRWNGEATHQVTVLLTLRCSCPLVKAIHGHPPLPLASVSERHTYQSTIGSSWSQIPLLSLTS